MKLYSLFKKKEFFINPGLERIREASKSLGNPHKSFKSILVSGTNGKGSTAAFLESLFRKHGYKTGLFTSPHLVRENERWQVNRQEVDNQTLQEYIKKIKPVIEEYNLTYFEASTLIAFLYFADSNVDIAILEVGLGGRWDATNIVEPELSIITNVSLDHTHLLGDTTEKIAFEKLGIARKDKPLILGSQQKELIKQAEDLEIRKVYVYGKDFKTDIISINPPVFDYFFSTEKIESIKLSLLGKYQVNNAATAITGFLVYQKKEKNGYDKEKIKKAIYKTKWSGRMQIIKQNPLIIIDGAHNEDAVKKSFNELKELFPNKEIITVYSGMKDKNFREIVKIVKRFSKETIITKIPVDRAISKEDITEFDDITFIPDIKKALDRAIELSDDKTLTFITGSLYLVGEVLRLTNYERV